MQRQSPLKVLALLCTIALLCAWQQSTALADLSNENTAPGDPPLEQTVDGVTMRLTTAGFKDRQFFAGGEIIAADPAVIPPGRLSEARDLRSRLFGPEGQVVADWDNHSREGVDPRWPYVTVECELRLPDAPPNADSTVKGELEFKDVPMPRKLDEPITLNREMTTAQGTKVLLKSVTARTRENQDGGIEGELMFSLFWTAPPERSDITFGFELLDLIDNSGVSRRGNLARGLSKLSLTRFYIYHPLPAGKIESLTLKLKVEETAPSLSDLRWFRRFRFNVKMPPVDAVAIAANKIEARMPTVSATADGVSAIIEDSGAITHTAWWDVFLWMRDQSDPPDPHLFWFPREIKARDTQGTYEGVISPPHWFSPGSYVPNGGYFPYWKTNGEVPASNERLDRTWFFFGTAARPQKLDVEVTAAAAHHLRHFVSFAGIPLPRPGQTLSNINQSHDDAGARITLKTVTRVTGPDSLIDLAPADLFRYHDHPPAGLELVFECIPALDPLDKTSFLCIQASDAEGRDLKTYGYGEQLPSRTGRKWSVFVQDVASAAKSFDVFIRMDELSFTGKTAKLQFPNVTVGSNRR